MDNIIKAGYSVTVHTWENDMDNCQHVTKNGYTAEHVKFLIDVFNIFNIDNEDCCNLYDFEDMSAYYSIAHAAQDVIKKHESVAATYKGYSSAFLNDLDDDDELAKSLANFIVYSIFSPFSGNSDYFTRVFEKAEVHFIEHEVTYPDVTDQFV